MFIIEYTAEGKAISDFGIPEFCATVAERVRLGSGRLQVANCVPIDAIRAAIFRGDIDYREITFEFKGERIVPDSSGHLSSWPPGFCDTYDKIINELADWGGEQRKRNFARLTREADEKVETITCAQIDAEVINSGNEIHKISRVKALRKLVGSGFGLLASKNWVEANYPNGGNPI